MESGWYDGLAVEGGGDAELALDLRVTGQELVQRAGILGIDFGGYSKGCVKYGKVLIPFSLAVSTRL
jgi:hypothetical protein